MFFNVHVSSHLFTLGLENQLDKIKIKKELKKIKKQQGRKDRKYKKMITPSDGDIKTKHKKNYHKGISKMTRG
jgi:hypothetical protein